MRLAGTRHLMEAGSLGGLAVTQVDFACDGVYSCKPSIHIWGLGGCRIDDIVVVVRTSAEALLKSPATSNGPLYRPDPVKRSRNTHEDQ